MGPVSFDGGNPETSEQTYIDFFSNAGKVVRIFDSQNERGSGVVTYGSAQEASAAVDMLDDVELEHRTIKLQDLSKNLKAYVYTPSPNLIHTIKAMKGADAPTADVDDDDMDESITDVEAWEEKNLRGPMTDQAAEAA